VNKKTNKIPPQSVASEGGGIRATSIAGPTGGVSGPSVVAQGRNQNRNLREKQTERGESKPDSNLRCFLMDTWATWEKPILREREPDGVPASIHACIGRSWCARHTHGDLKVSAVRRLRAGEYKT